jgi:circadian clock protein KaiB
MGSMTVHIELVLYTSPNTALSGRARRNMERLLHEYEPTQVLFTVCDISKNLEAAAADHIAFTPTLVRHFPEPRAWVLGDLEDPSAVIRMLRACGVRMRSPRSLRHTDSPRGISSRAR